MLFNVHIKLPTTISRSIDTITEVMGKISTVDNILFWTKDQINLMSGVGNEYILFKSYYGTGKSILLRAKCEQEAETNYLAGNQKRCLYVVGGLQATRKYTLPHMALNEHWRNKDYRANIQFISIYELMVSTEIIKILPLLYLLI